MAGFAGHAVRVLLGHDLRESFRPRSAGRVTAYAELRRIQLGRCYRRIGSMRRQRAVAGLAVHLLVLALVFQISLVGVAGITGLVTRVFGGMSRDLGHGGGTVVPVLAECFRYHVTANAPEDQKGDNKQACKTK